MKIEDMDVVFSPKTGKRIDIKQLLDDQENAKIALISRYPFFSELVDKLQPIYTWQVPTQATDGTRLFINPEFTSELSMHEKIFVMAHEVMHNALDHMGRARLHNHDHQISNIAGDYEINAMLANAGIMDAGKIKSKGFLYDKKYDDENWAYEQIYNDQPKGGGDKSKSESNGDEMMEYDEDFIKGYKQAIEDYKSGKLKL